MFLQSQLCHVVYLVILSTLTPVSLAIRVDWNTNNGPIVPPTSTIRPEPKRPFRDPAPVWEDQANDIPNPNPFKYILPPPSRPRIIDPDDNLQQQQQYQPHHHNKLVRSSTTVAPTPSTSTNTAAAAYNYDQLSRDTNIQNSQPVNTLGVNYVPNIGNKYTAPLPAYPKSQYWPETYQHYDKYDKLNGRYNHKLKKYKAYEQKQKFIPHYQFYPSKQYIYFKPQHIEEIKRWNLNTNYI